ncbi:Uncharacterised protein [Acidipropionibacterium jensenii]|uniref:AAA family ATPase n=1 Tax=Acidipropionibacterium jensenii TaxID=1749 RepID=A0A3S4YPM7_9ACTN|nr:AAA family ATPase [Acidipropionibacterium jensenii]VEI03489.1 Uncharacterised protein [Acidipropionibacterium jensenii]
MTESYDGPAFPEGDDEARQAEARYKARLLDKIHTGDWLDQHHFAPMQWMVPGLVPEGSGLLVGPPKIGKSWFALGLGLSVAAGGSALGAIHVEQRDVLYLALEDGDRRMQTRCRKLLPDGDPIPENFSYITDLVEERDILAVMDYWLDAHKGGLVMLDTLGKVMPAASTGQTQYQRDYNIGGRLKKVADDHPGSTVLTVHHSRKAESVDFMDSTSGTQGLNGAADFTIVLQRPRGENDAIIAISGRDVEEGSYAAVSENGSWSIDGDSLAEASHAAAQARLTSGVGDKMTQIVSLVSRSPEGISGTEVARATGLREDTVRQDLRRALKDGRILQPKDRGKYFPVNTVSQVSHVTSDDEPGNVTRDRCDTHAESQLTVVPDDPCPDCNLSLTGRTGSNTCSWRHTQAQQEAAS